jgi:hypothetical protein
VGFAMKESLQWGGFASEKNEIALQQGFVYYSKQKAQNILSKNP